ncbi:cytochrome b561 and DOMON domain-containing protein At3g25290-like [Magnolia sinica]|uniref:cytochrome b561 and DOMON domain-containing protein At3g25290-like n=1 Tax=Magnolia sinica TaxID=86752 RepID=UPI00265B013A|nr:cytochrome b561 and DOMON domain-containing protein At3g25290-like [Magnolia sinica]
MASPSLLLSFLTLLLLSIQSHSATCPSQTFSSNRIFTLCVDLPHLSSSLHWTYNASSSTLHLAFVAPPASSNGWISWAINPTGPAMIGSQSLIAFRNSSGLIAVQTFNISDYVIKPSKIAYNVSNLVGEYSDGVMRIFATVDLPTGLTTLNQVWQVGHSVTDGIPDKHDLLSENMNSKGTIDLLKGESGSSGTDSRLRKRNIHGILNAVSWGILMPFGVIFARYLRTFKSADPAWFYLHASCQCSAYVIGVAGWATGLKLGGQSKGVQYNGHRNIGIALFTLATLQVFALFLRPKKDHKFRIYWNYYHHSIGYSVIVLGIINVFKGLHILSPDDKWRIAYVAIIAAIGGIAVLLEVITWVVVLTRKSDNSNKLYDGSDAANGNRSGL